MLILKWGIQLLFLFGLCTTAYGAQLEAEEQLDRLVEKFAVELKALNLSIWSNPEVGLQETHAASVLSSFLEKHGFSVKKSVAGLSTSFLATAGTGKPVIGILAEYDALPGLSQAATPDCRPRKGAPAGSSLDIGHGCGHSVYATGSVGAAVAAYRAMKAAGLKGTIRLYGTPAEETMIGKVVMSRAGLFDDVDAVLHWHVSQSNGVMYGTSKAAVSVKFRFTGQTAHAAVHPEFGRSALDAVELMNIGANFLREHLRLDVRFHYVITGGGEHPNVVPARAEVWYYIRADDQKHMKQVYERIVGVAKGAALMTGTELTVSPITNVFELLPNRPLAELLHRQFSIVGPPQFSENEIDFGREMQRNFGVSPQKVLARNVDPLPQYPYQGLASSDVGNVSWLVPTAGVYVAAVPKKLPMHSWCVVAATGMSIGEKAMITAARILGRTVVFLFKNPIQLEKIRKDFLYRRDSGNIPVSVLPETHKVPGMVLDD